MAHLFRLIIVWSLACVSSLASAQITPVTGTEYQCNGRAWYPTAQQAGAEYNANGGPAGFWVGPFTVSFGFCQGFHPSNGNQINMVEGTIRTASTCPSNSTLTGSTCTCNSGFVQEGQTCVQPPNPCANHQQLWSSYNGSVQMVKGATSVCSGGCQVSFKPGYEGADLYGAGDDGVLRGWVPVGQLQSSNTEGTCSTPTEPAAQPVPDAERPPIGTCPGQVNGVTVYKPCSSTETTATKASTETDASGNTTEKTESRSTTCTAEGSCSTTVTTTTTVNGGSPTTTTNTTTQGKGEFCAENAGSKECGDGDGSSFGGSCDAGFICEGDAVQCALAKEVYTQHCKLNKVTDESTLYGAEKGREGDQTGDLPGNETIPFGPSSFDDSDALGGGACVSDLVISEGWISATLPLSMICPSLVWFRYALLAIGAFAWMLIVFRK